MSYGDPHRDPWPSVEDDPREIAAQRAAEHGAQCLRAIRWALEYHADIWLDHVYVEARDAFSWAGDAVSDRYCDVHQKEKPMGEYGVRYGGCEDCEHSGEDTFERALCARYPVREE